jgi:hypothetical protein
MVVQLKVRALEVVGQLWCPGRDVCSSTNPWNSRMMQLLLNACEILHNDWTCMEL